MRTVWEGVKKVNSENLTNKEGENPVNKEEKQKGRYHNDYSPRYQEAYDIYKRQKLI